MFHVDGTDGPVADVIFDGTTSTPSYVVSDPLGSTAVVLDAVGSLVAVEVEDAFEGKISARGHERGRSPGA